MCCNFVAVNQAAAQWFPRDAVSCNLDSSAINLGVFSRIGDQPPIATGNWGINCSSNAYPRGYPTTYNTIEGAFCITIAGRTGSRVLRGEGKNTNISIPFDFYFSRRKGGFQASFVQDYNTPIGDGTWGIAYIDWNYGNGKVINKPRPHQTNPLVSLPGHGLFDLKFSAATVGKAYPAGFYSATYPFRWRTGAARQNGNYPSPAGRPGVCKEFPGGGGSGSITVRMEVKKYCNITAKGDIDFGKQILLNKPLTAEGRIAVDCSVGTNYGVAVNDGLHSDGSGQRAMKRENGTEKIIYDIYQDSAMSQPWKSDWSGSSILRGNNADRERQFPVYAAVPPQQSKPAGVYTDTLIVEVRVLD